jgi:hypothetical protein
MRYKGFSRDSGGLRMFFVYGAVVLLFVFVSLVIKGFLVFQKSKFDGEHHFTLVVAKGGRAEELIAFNPSTTSLYLLKIKGNASLSSLGETIGIVPDAIIETKVGLPLGEDVTQTMLHAALTYTAIKTDLTIFDMVRLIFLSKSMTEDNKIMREVSLSQSSDIDKIIASYFVDEAISAEGVSIQIVNASDTPGVGKRLERVLGNMGANVVRVSSSEKEEKHSKIQYFDKPTYTLKKLMRTFGFPVSILDKAGIATITITIGEDSVGTSKF